MPDHAPFCERLFTLESVEIDTTCDWPSGLSPLEGTCYWNGPGRFVRGDLRYRNWLDGDGLVCALRLGDGRARFTSRFVRSAKLREEDSAGRALFRTFGTAFAGDRLKRGIGLESPVNVSVYQCGSRLLAFGEQGLPWQLDPGTLDTRGQCTFGGQLNDITPFSAHPKLDPVTGEMFNFGVMFSAARPALNVFRFDPHGTLRYRRRLPLPFASSIHDFALSGSYAVFQISPYILDMSALMRDGAALIDALSWQPDRGSQLFVVSRETGELVASIPTGRGYCLHLVNAFERDGALVVDLVEYERPLYDQYQVIPDLFTDVSMAVPVRLTLEVSGQQILDRRTLAYHSAPDFPAHEFELTGRPYDEFWMLGISAAGRSGRKFFDELVHASWDRDRIEVYRMPAGRYLGGEPLVVPDPAEPGRRVIVCQQHDAEALETSLVFFDGRRVSDGPVATLPLGAAIPASFHSSYVAGRPDGP